MEAGLMENVDLSKLDGFKFVRGMGRLEAKEACLFTAASVLAGEPWGDRLTCVCPVITEFGIRLSDQWHDETDRGEFVRKYAPLVIGTRSTREVERRRWDILSRAALTEFAPQALDSAASAHERKGYTEHATKLRDYAQRLRINPSTELAREARAAAVAAAYADAADAAAAAAHAAVAAAYAAADAAAAYAADAAAAAAAPLKAKKEARAQARRGLRGRLLQLFDELIAITDPTQPTAAQEAL
jgi:hypothetical protein